MQPLPDTYKRDGKERKRSTNVQLYCMEVGESFRFLDKYGKPTGPRHTLIAEYESHSEALTANGDLVTFNTIDIFQKKVKPINFTQLIVEARMTWPEGKEFPWKRAL